MGHPTNTDYWRDFAWYTAAGTSFVAFNLAVQNHSGVTAHDVRVDLTVPNTVATLRDESGFPQKPRKVRTSVPSMPNISLPPEPRVSIEYLSNMNVLHVVIPKVQPHSTVWLSDAIYIAVYRNGEVVLEGSIAADNLPTPAPARLKFDCQSQEKRLEFTDLEQVEKDRFAAEEGRALLLAMEARRMRENGGG